MAFSKIYCENQGKFRKHIRKSCTCIFDFILSKYEGNGNLEKKNYPCPMEHFHIKFEMPISDKICGLKDIEKLSMSAKVFLKKLSFLFNI